MAIERWGLFHKHKAHEKFLKKILKTSQFYKKISLFSLEIFSWVLCLWNRPLLNHCTVTFVGNFQLRKVLILVQKLNQHSTFRWSPCACFDTSPTTKYYNFDAQLINVWSFFPYVFFLFWVQNVIQLLRTVLFCANVIIIDCQHNSKSSCFMEMSWLLPSLYTILNTFPARLPVCFFRILLDRWFINTHERGTGIAKMKWACVPFAQTNMQFYAVSIPIISFQIQLATEKKKETEWQQQKVHLSLVHKLITIRFLSDLLYFHCRI